ncbi:MAG: alpha/beta fold hydrolase [Acidimicrobiales bacterium]
MLACVHGLEGSHLNWTAIGPRLAGTARVVAIDLVGHDRTPMAGRRADAEGRRRLLSGMLEALGEGPVTLIGNSMGGLVAALQAAVRPESVPPPGADRSGDTGRPAGTGAPESRGECPHVRGSEVGGGVSPASAPSLECRRHRVADVDHLLCRSDLRGAAGRAAGWPIHRFN